MRDKWDIIQHMWSPIILRFSSLLICFLINLKLKKNRKGHKDRDKISGHNVAKRKEMEIKSLTECFSIWMVLFKNSVTIAILKVYDCWEEFEKVIGKKGMNFISLSHLLFLAVYRNPWTYRHFHAHGVGEFSQGNYIFTCQEEGWRSTHKMISSVFISM